jgi:hypothetical protein
VFKRVRVSWFSVLVRLKTGNHRGQKDLDIKVIKISIKVLKEFIAID